MADGFRSALPKARVRRAETALDRSTRLARDILEEETQQREIKTAQLRQSRLERESEATADDNTGTVTGAANMPPTDTRTQD